MTPEEFVEKNLQVDTAYCCPRTEFHARCKAAGISASKVLREIRRRHGRRTWLDNKLRITLPDGSRPRAIEGFRFKDMAEQIPRGWAGKLWPHLPHQGTIAELAAKVGIALTPNQVGWARKSKRLAVLREKQIYTIVRDIDGDDFDRIMDREKLRSEDRTEKKLRRDAYQDTTKPPRPFTKKLLEYLPPDGYKGPVSALPFTKPQLFGACKSKHVAMVCRKDEVWIVPKSSEDYEIVHSMGRDRRRENMEQWESYQEEFRA